MEENRDEKGGDTTSFLSIDSGNGRHLQIATGHPNGGSMVSMWGTFISQTVQQTCSFKGTVDSPLLESPWACRLGFLKSRGSDWGQGGCSVSSVVFLGSGKHLLTFASPSLGESMASDSH